MRNGYTQLVPVGITAEAQMLETVAGYDDRDVDRELSFARSMTDFSDANSVRWLICLLARKVDDLAADDF